MTADPLEPLREALRVTPDNVPLRNHVATSLLQAGRADEAEQVCRAGLKLNPAAEALSRTLVRAFLSQRKHSEAFVVLEALLPHAKEKAQALLLSARVHAATGDRDKARRAYLRAVDEDPDLADDDLVEELGLEIYEEDDDRRVPTQAPPDPAAGVSEAFERPKIDFSDVGGMNALKEEIRLKIIHPLQHPEIYEAYGKAAGGGILMYGPPGCGKTHLARATAGEVKAGFLSVGIHDVLDMWLGNSESKLHEIFRHARERAPCVLFFDEVDALGASRSDMRGSGGRHVINQFLSELDGVHADNEGVLILAATNTPWHVDSAFRRPGRFDRVLFVPPPDEAGRTSILEALCRGKPQDGIDFAKVAAKTKECSGADLKGLIDLAVEDKLREAIKTGAPSPLRTRDLLAAVKKARPTTKEWFATARNHALYSNQGGIYDDILRYLGL